MKTYKVTMTMEVCVPHYVAQTNGQYLADTIERILQENYPSVGLEGSDAGIILQRAELVGEEDELDD